MAIFEIQRLNWEINFQAILKPKFYPKDDKNSKNSSKKLNFDKSLPLNKMPPSNQEIEYYYLYKRGRMFVSLSVCMYQK